MPLQKSNLEICHYNFSIPLDMPLSSIHDQILSLYYPYQFALRYPYTELMPWPKLFPPLLPTLSLSSRPHLPSAAENSVEPRCSRTTRSLAARLGSLLPLPASLLMALGDGMPALVVGPEEGKYAAAVAGHVNTTVVFHTLATPSSPVLTTGASSPAS